MRKLKLMSVSAFAAVLMFGAPPAQAQCLLCGAIGYALGSAASSSDQASIPAAGGGAVMYVAPRISERIKDPLGVRIASSRAGGFTKNSQYWGDRFMSGFTIQQIFNTAVDNPNDYAILEVVRAFKSDESTSAVFWFAYIERDKLSPLEQLPAPAVKQ